MDSYDNEAYLYEINKRNIENLETLIQIRQKIKEIRKNNIEEIEETGELYKFYCFRIDKVYRVSMYYTDFDHSSGNIHRIPGYLQVWRACSKDKLDDCFKYFKGGGTSACYEVYKGQCWSPCIDRAITVEPNLLNEVVQNVQNLIQDREVSFKNFGMCTLSQEGLFTQKRKCIVCQIKQLLGREKLSSLKITKQNGRNKYKDIQWIMFEDLKTGRVDWITFWKMKKDQNELGIFYGDICLYKDVTCTVVGEKRRYGLSRLVEGNWELREQPDEIIGNMGTKDGDLVKKIINALKYME